MRTYKDIEADLLKIQEIQQQVINEAEGLVTERLPWTQADLITAILAGSVGVAIDLVSKGSLSEGQSKKLVSPFSKFDRLNSPIDKNIPGASLGDHRIYSQGHDLVRFFSTAKHMMTGSAINYHSDGGQLVVKGLSQGSMTLSEAMAVLTVHLIKDVFTARSLPIPGTSVIAGLNNHKVPDFLVKGYSSNDLNLKNGMGASLATGTPMLVSNIYTSLNYKDANAEQKKQKRTEIEALGQLMITAISSGHAAITKNPLKINYASLLRLCVTSLQLLDGHSKRLNNSKIRSELRLLILDLEQRKTQLAIETMHITLDCNETLLLDWKKAG